MVSLPDAGGPRRLSTASGAKRGGVRRWGRVLDEKGGSRPRPRVNAVSKSRVDSVVNAFPVTGNAEHFLQCAAAQPKRCRASPSETWRDSTANPKAEGRPRPTPPLPPQHPATIELQMYGGRGGASAAVMRSTGRVYKRRSGMWNDDHGGIPAEERAVVNVAPPSNAYGMRAEAVDRPGALRPSPREEGEREYIGGVRKGRTSCMEDRRRVPHPRARGLRASGGRVSQTPSLRQPDEEGHAKPPPQWATKSRSNEEAVGEAEGHARAAKPKVLRCHLCRQDIARTCGSPWEGGDELETLLDGSPAGEGAHARRRTGKREAMAATLAKRGGQ
ncbi:hypothetical protein B0H14DRAFT_3156172 [Mycena olivaceomarginata]|nr:hypothetical protein B0H14DRAFT_3156172 [Mycena olivaceomarginata]